MAITFDTENVRFTLKEKTKIKKWLTALIKADNKRVGEIGYEFCDDDHLLEVNISYLNHDTYTDIITFDYVEDDTISGDILISIDRIRENATTFAVPFEEELHRVIAHGVLHLLGQGDKTKKEASEMRKKENAALALWNTIE